MASRFPFNLCSPLTGQIWKFPHPCANSESPGAFGQGRFGTHTGEHLSLGAKKAPIYAPCAGHIVHSNHQTLLIRFHLPWPNAKSPPIWSLFSGSVEWFSKSPFQASDILGYGEKEIHWEIFLNDIPEKSLSNPLREWNHAMGWNFMDFPYLQGFNEFAGPTKAMQKQFETYCEKHSLKKEAYQNAFENYFSTHNLWKSAQQKDSDLPIADQCYHVHPWRFLEKLHEQGTLLPTFRNKLYPDEIDWKFFCGFVSQVHQEVQKFQCFSDDEGILAIGRALLTQIGMFDWRQKEAWNASWEDMTLAQLQLKPVAKSLLLLWLRFRVEEPCYVLYCTKGCDPFTKPWNLQLLVHGSKKQDSTKPITKSSHTLDFYGPPTHNATHSLFAPSLRWYISPLTISPGLHYSFSVEVITSHNLIWDQKLTWEFTQNHRTLFKKTTDSPWLEISLNQALTSHEIEVTCELHYQGIQQKVLRSIPVIHSQMATISQLQSTLSFGKKSIPLSPLDISSLAIGRYVKIQDLLYQHSQQFQTIQLTDSLSHPSSITNSSIHVPVEIIKNFQWEPLTWIQVIKENLQTLPSQPLARLRALGYWCEGAPSHPIRTFQAEWGIHCSGILDTSTLQILAKAKHRPGLPVNATTYRKKKKSGILNGQFYQLPAPKNQEYKRYGDIIATPKYGKQRELLGVEHNENWARRHMIEAIQVLCMQWWKKTGETMQIGDLSLWCGGLMREHQSHQKGTSMDCRTHTVGAYTMLGKQNKNYSVQNTIEFCKMAHRLGFGPIYTSCKQVLRKIGPDTSSAIVIYQPHHQHHLHLEHRG